MTMARVAVWVLIMMMAVVVGGTSAARAQVGDNRELVNPNLASADELSELPGLTGSLVDGLIERRPFLTMTEVDAYLSGTLGRSELEELYQALFLPINLNTAPRAEILLVPGIGDRMAHEFEEYRPYLALGQFRREIGKYVDDAEVEQFERHVFVPIDLNTASDEAILSIPGLGQRLLHEFKEYRPYRALAQFRREIGKYVDADEVARLERYVVVK